MKCLTLHELAKLLNEQGARLSGKEEIDFPKGSLEKLMVSFPEKTLGINRLAAFLVDWTSKAKEHCLFFSYWGTEPIYPVLFIEKFRSSFGENRRLADAPAQLFDSSVEEGFAMMTEMVFLAMAFDWNAYIFKRGSNDYIFLSDEHVLFVSHNASKIDEAARFSNQMNLHRVERWTVQPS
jgi:hypothetical protein